MLFNNITRRDKGPRGYSEPLYDYLNRSARTSSEQIRSLLNEWFSRFSSPHKKDLKSRFCSSDDVSHQSAFFELYMHEFLLKLGFRVDVHPDRSGKSTHPEFLVYLDEEPTFYLECTLAVGSEDEVAAKKRENIVYDTLDKMESPNFFLEIKVKNYSKAPPSGAKWRKILKKRLSELDPDELQPKVEDPDSLPKWKLEDKDWEVIFTPIPKSLEARGKPGIRPIGITWFGPMWVKDHIHIRNSINKKATYYGEFELPYIIAVNVISFFLDDISIEEALFGDEIITAFRKPNGSFGHKPERKKNGSWIGPKGPQNTRVSGVVIFNYLLWGNIEKINPIFWHNPWAQKQLELEFWPFSQKKVHLQDGRIEIIEGKSISEIFGLQEDWPDTEDNKD